MMTQTLDISPVVSLMISTEMRNRKWVLFDYWAYLFWDCINCILSKTKAPRSVDIEWFSDLFGSPAGVSWEDSDTVEEEVSQH